MNRNKAYLQQKETLQKMRSLKKPYEKVFEDLTISVFPKVYSAGMDSALLYRTLQVFPGDEVLDLCTGTGIVALRAKKLGAKKAVAADLNPEAVKNTRYNSRNLNIPLDVREGDLFDSIKNETFDVVSINPPFSNQKAADKIEIAFWDKDYSLIKRFFEDLHKHLKPYGRVYLAWSSFGDKKILLELAKKHRFTLKLVASQKGKTGFFFYVYEIRYSSDLNLLAKNYGPRIRVYDFVRKYGDWFFKIPLLYSLQKVGYELIYNSAHILPHMTHIGRPDKKSQAKIAFVFTRSDKSQILHEIFALHQVILELRRQDRQNESLYIWVNGKVAVQKNFTANHEEDRIKYVIEFLNLPIQERKIKLHEPHNQHMVVSFTASENIKSRLSHDIPQIERFLTGAAEKFQLIYITKDKASDPILPLLSSRVISLCKVIITREISDAFRVINKASYFFGSDSGLAHYAVQKGKIVFALFNSKYSGAEPLFNSSSPNHLTFFGDKNFAGEALFYLDNSHTGKKLTFLYETISAIIVDGWKKIETDVYSNEYKFTKYLFLTVYSANRMKTALKNEPYSSNLIFNPDYI